MDVFGFQIPAWLVGELFIYILQNICPMIMRVYISLLALPHCPVFCEYGERWGFPSGSLVKNPTANARNRVQSQGQEDPREKEMANHSSILAWRNSRTEELSGLQSMGSQRDRHNSATNNKSKILNASAVIYTQRFKLICEGRMTTSLQGSFPGKASSFSHA